MMTAEQYRLKAQEAREVAKQASDPLTKREWEHSAREWDELGRIAEVQDPLHRVVAELDDE